MHNADASALETYLTDRGFAGRGEKSEKRLADEERQTVIRTRGERVQEWRAFIPTVAPAATTASLQVVREAAGLTQGDVADITGQAVSHIVAAERGQETVADSALRGFIGAATVALQNAGPSSDDRARRWPE